MKVKEYLVSEILELKHNIRKLQEDIARKDTMIESQRNRIAAFEKREENYKLHSNSLYGTICEVRQIVSDNMLHEPSDCSGWFTVKDEDFDKLLNILGLDKQEVPDEVPED